MPPFPWVVGSQLEYYSQRWESRMHEEDRAGDGAGRNDLVTPEMVE